MLWPKRSSNGSGNTRRSIVEVGPVATDAKICITINSVRVELDARFFPDRLSCEKYCRVFNGVQSLENWTKTGKLGCSSIKSSRSACKKLLHSSTTRNISLRSALVQDREALPYLRMSSTMGLVDMALTFPLREYCLSRSRFATVVPDFQTLMNVHKLLCEIAMFATHVMDEPWNPLNVSKNVTKFPFLSQNSRGQKNTPTNFRRSKCNFLTRCGLHEMYVTLLTFVTFPLVYYLPCFLGLQPYGLCAHPC